MSWYDGQQGGLGDRFLASVDDAIARIERNPLHFPAVVLDVRRALVPRFPYGLFFRVDGDGSVVIACLHHRRAPAMAIRRALGPKQG